MPWFRVDDGSAFHTKVLAAGNEAWGAFCRGGAQSSKEMRDGFVPEASAFAIAPRRVWSRLLAVGLVHEVDGGYQMHDFLQWNPSAAEVEKTREELSEKRRKAGLLGNAKRWDGHRKTGRKCDRKPVASAIANESQTIALSHPGPSDLPSEDPPVVPKGDTRKRPSEARKGTGRATPAKVVFDHWRSKLMPRAVETKDRIARISARLNEGFTVGQLCSAVDGAERDDWLMGRDPKSNGRSWKDVKTVFRDAGQVERLVEIAESSVSGVETDNEWPDDGPIQRVELEPDLPDDGIGVAPPPEFQQAVLRLAESVR